MRKIALAIMFGALSAACGSAGSGTSGTNPAAPSQATASAQAQSKPVDPRKGGFDVGFGEFAITLEAKAIRPGLVTLVVHNGGKLIHGFEMKSEDEGGSHSGHGGGDRFKIEAATFGPDDTIRIKANLPAGIYEIECYVANHESLGMRTILRVSPDAPLVRPKTAAAGEVLIQGFKFDPETIQVAAGTTVNWLNEDPTAHTVTAADGSFSSDPLPGGKGFRVTFDRPGSFAYSCAIHPTMTGTVKVSS